LDHRLIEDVASLSRRADELGERVKRMRGSVPTTAKTAFERMSSAVEKALVLSDVSARASGDKGVSLEAASSAKAASSTALEATRHVKTTSTAIDKQTKAVKSALGAAKMNASIGTTGTDRVLAGKSKARE
jgi:hypothetical protein